MATQRYGLPVAGFGADFRQRDLPAVIVGILLDQSEVLREGLAQSAAAALGLRIGAARLAVGAVKLEYVAELHQGTIDIARLNIFQTCLEMFFGALLCRIARHKQPKRGGERDRRQEPA